MKTLLDWLAEDENISPAMRACMRPAKREICWRCGGAGVAMVAGNLCNCAQCAGRGYVITERSEP